MRLEIWLRRSRRIVMRVEGLASRLYTLMEEGNNWEESKVETLWSWSEERSESKRSDMSMRIMREVTLSFMRVVSLISILLPIPLSWDWFYQFHRGSKGNMYWSDHCGEWATHSGRCANRLSLDFRTSKIARWTSTFTRSRTTWEMDRCYQCRMCSIVRLISSFFHAGK